MPVKYGLFGATERQDTYGNWLPRRNSTLRMVIVEPNVNESPGLAFDDLLQKLGLKQDDWKRRIRVIKGKFREDSFVYDKIKETAQRLDDWATLESWVPNQP